MSLFGSNQQTTSPFGNLGNTSAAQQQSNPFAKPAGGSLFGSTTGQSNILFPPTSTVQPSSSGNTLFGKPLQTSQTLEPLSGTSLFGNLGAQQQQQPASTSLFGGSTLQSGQQQQAQIGNIPSISLFCPGQAPQTQQNVGNIDGQLPQVTSTTSATTALFQNLLERGKSRQSEANGGLKLGELPSLKLGLSDIADKVRNLGASPASSHARGGTKSRAHYLLAASGVPRASTLRDLDDFSAQGRSSSTSPAPLPLDTDIDAYVNSLQAKSSAELFQDYMTQTKRDFDAFVEERFQMDQHEQRQRIYEHFGLSRAEGQSNASRNGTPNQAGRGAFGRSSRRLGPDNNPQPGYGRMSPNNQSLSNSVLGRPVGRGSVRGSTFPDVAERVSPNAISSPLDDPSLRNKQEKYASKVRELNNARLQDQLYPVIEEFARVEIESSEDTPQHLIDAYKAVRKITGESSAAQRPSDAGAVRERQYAKDYLDASDSGRSLQMKKRILARAKAYLEESFFTNIEGVVARNPREANLGGVPSKINKVRAYTRVRALRKDLGTDDDVLQKIGDDYCWVLIFFLLRSGLIQEAAQYVTENDRAMRAMDRQFPNYMALYASDSDGRLANDQERNCQREYQNRLQNSPEKSLDPYRMACYKIIGRCDLSTKNLSGVSTSLEDWVWVIFSLAREVPRTQEAAGQSFDLEDVRLMIDQIGQRHFHASEESSGGYATFFFLQILAGMFEKAVAWLQPHNPIVAMHFAIALDFYGLLRISEASTTETRLLTESNAQKPQINFGRLLGYYTQDFRLGRAADACDYMTLLCMNADVPGSAGAAHVSVCHEALKELVLETREFTLLLGDVRDDGQRVKGAIELRLPLLSVNDGMDFLKDLTVQAAAVADDSGRTTDAVLLYHLAEEYDNVIVVINRALSEAISVELGRERMRLQPLNKPAVPGQQQQPNQQQQGGSSLSLTSVDEPAVLARNLIGLYNNNAMIFRQIRQVNRDACGILIRLSEVRERVETGRWAEALDMIANLELLPLRAKGNVSVIRSSAQAFSSLPEVVARNIGNLLIWTITCLGKQREAIRSSTFQVQRPVADDLLVMAKDLMVFAGLIRYKLPPDVFEVLALGAY